jgi:UDP-galactopyranose mutase
MNLDLYDFVVVGAGFYGSVIAERIANDLKKRVLVIEKRDHIGGNCYSLVNDETGIEYHKYGTHIFHTSNLRVWEYINKFTSFNNYNHQVLTTYNDRVYQMPINLETINSFYKTNLKPFEVDAFLEKEYKKEFYPSPKNFEEQAISAFGRPIYEALFKGYTTKQWGRKPKEIASSVLKRLPFRKNYKESYFFDKWQGIPLSGYTKLFNNLLSSDYIDILLNTDYIDIRDQISDKSTIIYSGGIDSLFDYKFGDLEYRTLEFELEVKSVTDYQGTSVMNYANLEIPYTRIHEPKHLHTERNYSTDKTLIIKEYSKEAQRKEPYYPIGGEKNRALYTRYLDELRKYKNIIVGGRLGDYKYYDMHHTIEKALATYETKIKNG